MKKKTAAVIDKHYFSIGKSFRFIVLFKLKIYFVFSNFFQIKYLFQIYSISEFTMCTIKFKTVFKMLNLFFFLQIMNLMFDSF